MVGLIVARLSSSIWRQIVKFDTRLKFENEDEPSDRTDPSE
jgi:hypothetical protein